jgi:hypothetical protein
MSIKVTLTEEEILERPNYYQLGEFVQNKYWQARRDSEGPQFDDEHFLLTIDEEGLVNSINYNNLKELDKCVICGKESPYTKSTHIDLREGYVEGAGQGCFQPNICEK